MNHLLAVPAGDSFFVVIEFYSCADKPKEQKAAFFYVPVIPMGTHSIGGRPMRFIKLKEVMHKTALSRSSVYRKMDEGQFPKSISTGDRSVVWKES
jgi:prophage regulatory protein